MGPRYIDALRRLLWLVMLPLLCHATASKHEATQTSSVFWTIPEKKLPLPACASTQVQQTLARIKQPDIEARKHFEVPTKEEWKAWAEYSEETGNRGAKAWAKRYGVHIEKQHIGTIPVYALTPSPVTKKNQKRRFVYLHGGAYVFGRGMSGLSEGILIAARTGIPVLAVDYRMPPDHPFPAAVEDSVRVYKNLLKRYRHTSIAMGGSSAGGGLVLSVVQHLKAKHIPLPGALFAGTPWADLDKCGDSLYINEGIDRKIVTYDGFVAAAARLYANGKPLRTPGISPVYGDFNGFPPTLLATGTRDLFLSLTVRVHRKMKAAGVVADLNVYEGLSHVEYFVIPESPESHDLYRQLKLFLDTHLH